MIGLAPLRLLDFRPHEGQSLFVDLDDLAIDGFGYRLIGGHRLWVAPEVPAKTYATENTEVEITEGPDFVTATAGPDASGIGKALTVSFVGDATQVGHTLKNHSDTAIDVAPWAITQLVPGGRAILPLDRDPVDAAGLQGSGGVTLWPYTDMSQLAIHPRYLDVTDVAHLPLKVGVTLQSGALVYQHGSNVFSKATGRRATGTYADQGAAGQCYVHERFVELETLGPVVSLEPGEETSHTERWTQTRVEADLSSDELYEMYAR
jgi:hypothetical protein